MDLLTYNLIGGNNVLLKVKTKTKTSVRDLKTNSYR